MFARVVSYPARQAFDPTIPPPSEGGRKDMWGGNSRLVALFPREWELRGVVSSLEEVITHLVVYTASHPRWFSFESQFKRSLSCF